MATRNGRHKEKVKGREEKRDIIRRGRLNWLQEIGNIKEGKDGKRRKIRKRETEMATRHGEHENIM